MNFFHTDFFFLQARDILELGLKNVSFARKAVALNDGKNIADVTWVKVCPQILGYTRFALLQSIN